MHLEFALHCIHFYHFFILDTVNWFIGSDILMNKDVPIMFVAVDGFSRQTENDCSLFNMKEAKAIVDQIDILLKFGTKQRKVQCSDIGVVSPYKLQCKIIDKLCRRMGFNGITVGTAEVYQGQEKPVMIVSTVCTGGILGFVNSAQVRFILLILFTQSYAASKFV